MNLLMNIKIKQAYCFQNLMVKVNIPQWRQVLKSAQIKEGNTYSSKWMQLATTNEKNEPRLRTVVFREWKNNTSMIIFTDKRTKKVRDIELNKNVEILWLFFKSKSQFRFKGNAELIPDKIDYWNKLSAKSKEKWYWPHPGKKRNNEDFNNNLISSNPPENFLIIQINLEIIELLKLSQPFHKRYSWQKDHNWERTELNP